MISVDVGALIALVLHPLEVHFDIKVFGWRPFHRETVINDVVAAHVLIERGVVHPAVALDLRAKQLDPKGIVDEWYVHDALDVLSEALLERGAQPRVDRDAQPAHKPGGSRE